MKALSEDNHFATSENGWTNNEIGFSWLKQCFEPETRRNQKGDYRLLIIDDHQSHSTSKVIDFAEKHKIIRLCLPTHSTDLLQPLDVDIFGPLAQAYRNQLEAMTRYGFDYVIDKTNFIKMYQKAGSTAMTPQVIQSAWAKSGLSPLNPERVLESLPFRDSRPITPPEMTLTSSSEASLTVPFTPTNSAEIDLLIERIVEHDDEDAQASKKLAKACTSAMADYQMMTITNKSLIQVAERQHEKNTRTRDYYGEAKVMNQAVLEECRQEAASKAVSKGASKVKGKSDRKNASHMNQVMKAFMRLDPTIFNDDRKQSPKKKTPSNQSAELDQSAGLDQTSLPPFLEDLHPQPAPPTSSTPARQPRKRAPKAIEAPEQQSQVPPQATRSGRLIRPRNLDL